MAFVAHVTKASRKGGTTRQGNKIISLGDLYRHNERVGAYGNAENIDKSQTQHNYSLDDFDKSVDYETRLDEVKKRYGITARERSVAVASMVISGSPEEMASMSEDEQKQYFADVRDKLSEHFGADTLVYAQVHNDEKTPHMHIGYVPVYKNEAGKNAIRWGDIKKDRETGAKVYRGPVHRDFLKYLQNDLPAELIEKGYNIKIGGKTSTRHVDTAEWREVQHERDHLKESYRKRFEKIEEKESSQTQREHVLNEREAGIQEQERRNKEITEQTQRYAQEMKEKERKQKSEKQRVDFAVHSLSSGLGLSNEVRAKLVKAKNPSDIGKLIGLHVNKRTRVNGAVQIGTAIDNLKSSNQYTILSAIADKKMSIPNINALSLGVLEHYIENTGTGYKQSKLADAVQGATIKQAEKGFERYVSGFTEKERATVLQKIKANRAKREQTIANEKPINITHQKSAEKSSDLGRSR